MVIYVVFRFVQTNKTPPPSQTTPIVTAPPADPGRAFIRFVDAPSETTKAAPYTLTLDTNEWATCAVDVYGPDEIMLPLTKEAAKPQSISPGRMQWTWNVPSDALSGTWLLRVLCGSIQDLATVDQKVEVR
jgi:hypothetical protein